MVNIGYFTQLDHPIAWNLRWKSKTTKLPDILVLTETASYCLLNPSPRYKPLYESFRQDVLAAHVIYQTVISYASNGLTSVLSRVRYIYLTTYSRMNMSVFRYNQKSPSVRTKWIRYRVP